MQKLLNKYLEIKQPWKLIKENKSPKSPASTCLYISAEMLRISSVLLHPIMPTKTMIILEALAQANNKSIDFGELMPNTNIKNPGSLFPRIEE